MQFTKKDKETLEFIVNHLRIPSLQQIADALEISKSAANERVKRLKAQNKIKTSSALKG